MEIGTFGEIATRRMDSGTYQSATRFRDWDGKVRRVSATGTTKAKAVMALKKRIADRDPVGETGEAVTLDSPFGKLTQLWLEDVELDSNLSDGTKHVYEAALRTLVTPAFEHFTVREITSARVERYIKVQAAKSYSKARQSKVILSLVMKFAMRHGIITRNPVDATTPLRKPHHAPKALAMEELTAIRRAVRTWRTGEGLPGPKPDGQLRDLIEVMLGTSARIGEALGLRRCDVDVTTNPATVHICGTVVVRKGKGVFRQDFPKTDKSDRIVAMPQFAADVIRRRLARTPDGDPEHLLFFTKHETPLSPSNTRRIFREVLKLAGLSGRNITPHAFRRTVATIIAEEAGDELAAETLGHTQVQMTRDHYIEPKVKVNPQTATILEKLAPASDVED